MRRLTKPETKPVSPKKTEKETQRRFILLSGPALPWPGSHTSPRPGYSSHAEQDAG
jgi:hypothetical protein